MPRPEAITHVILHITAGPCGNAESIRHFHVSPKPAGRGWADIGYHWVVLNAFPTYEAWREKQPDPESDGKVEGGRDIDHDGDIDEETGAHAYGYNSRSLGIAFVSMDGSLTGAQVKAGLRLCREKLYQYEVPLQNVLGHTETGARKVCPGIDMDHFRELLRGWNHYG